MYTTSTSSSDSCEVRGPASVSLCYLLIKQFYDKHRDLCAECCSVAITKQSSIALVPGYAMRACILTTTVCFSCTAVCYLSLFICWSIYLLSLCIGWFSLCICSSVYVYFSFPIPHSPFLSPNYATQSTFLRMEINNPTRCN